MMTLAQRMRDPSLLMEAHHALGASLASLGESVSAQEHFDQALALYDPEQHRALAFSYGYDTGVVCYMRGSLNLWVLGYPDLALERIDKALQLAEENSQHPHTLAAALDSNCLLHTFRGEWQAVRESAEAMIALSSERGFSQFLALGDFRLGSVLVEQGQSEEGILRMHRGLSGWQATGAGRARPYLLSLLAEAYGKIGQREEGFSVLDEALAIADKNDERFHEAELYRLKGQLTLQSKVQSPDSQVEKGAEECFLKAIEIARLQQAKSLELRATMSLARLWQRQGKRREAHSLLSEIYGWFTEGFDTRDLQEAKALLEELAKKSDKTID
jgi:adenylate cyclase